MEEDDGVFPLKIATNPYLDLNDEVDRRADDVCVLPDALPSKRVNVCHVAEDSVRDEKEGEDGVDFDRSSL